MGFSSQASSPARRASRNVPEPETRILRATPRSLRCDRGEDAELGALLEPPLRLRRGRRRPVRPISTERGDPLPPPARRGRRRRSRARSRGRRPARRSAAAGDVDEDVGGAERYSGVAGEDGDDHREPLRVDTRADAARHRQVGGRHERLDLEQDRSASLPARRRPLRRSRPGVPCRRARTGPAHRRAPVPCLEHAELVRRAEQFFVARRTRWAW